MDVDRQVQFDDLRMGALSHLAKGTAANYKTVINRINKEKGWDRDVVYVDRMINDSTGVVDIIRNSYKLVDTSSFRAKVSKVSCVITATGLVGDDHIFKQYINNAGRYLSIDDTKDQKNDLDWLKLSEDLYGYGVSGTDRLNTIGLVFSYGYTLRCGEIIDTTVDGTGENNLDLDSGEWTIRRHKNCKNDGETGGPRVFTVCESLREQLADRSGDKWLTETERGSKHHTRYLNWEFPNNWEIRSSRQTWLQHESGYSQEEINRWCDILGHKKSTSKVYYDNTVKFPKDGDSKTEDDDFGLDECQTTGASPAEDSE